MSKVCANTIQKTVRLPINLYDKIESVAKDNKTSSSYIIRYILEEYFRTTQNQAKAHEPNQLESLFTLIKEIKLDTERIKEATGAN